MILFYPTLAGHFRLANEEHTFYTYITLQILVDMPRTIKLIAKLKI